ncbi:methyl-accepting chemotaxis protein MCP signaling domain protein [Asticcacaulis biprosthecium C19]|uniref:Methyl-accepting chemotaxis protein MCP signaling domain protein n=1 Tax=Asticcacaulis biprosthecium C19 TaxID=715226 RepID=F4QPJ5_9CAUL|nr:methyl-accepting chemotaxis protein [Asticcacaulis biprosthecium]EGF91253.1 methyl-accepting chemotaxis protein MCP signaling domain protein [Asticcacaulis biprosthecium C19]
MTKQGTKQAGGFQISNWPFTVKFMAPAAVATAILVVLTGGAVYIMNGQGKAIDEINNKAMPQIVELGDIKSNIKEANGQLFNALTKKATDPTANASAAVAKVVEDLAKTEARVKADADKATSPEQKKQFSDLAKEIKTYKEAVEFAGSVMDVDFASVGPLMSQFDDGYAKMSQITDQMIEANVAEAKASAADAKKAQTSGVTMLAIFAAIMAALSMGIAFIFSRVTVTGINRIAKTTEELATGNLNVDISALARRDELKSVVDSLNVFKANAEEKARLSAMEAATAKTREERARQMSELAERFRHEAQDMLDALSSAASDLDANGRTLLTIAQENERRSQSAVSSIRNSADNVQNVASATTELSASIGVIGDQAVRSVEIAAEAVSEADRTNASMAELSRAADQIGEVVDLINAIAQQTNLLALNATIESARAGEAGKGFAVVASEVKSLAQQTAKATDEIRDRIKDIQSAAQNGVNAIRGIGETIKHMNEIASSIADSVHQQGDATNEIARNVNEASDGTTMASSSVAQLSASAADTEKASTEMLGAANQLTKRTEAMSENIRRFLGELTAA